MHLLVKISKLIVAVIMVFLILIFSGCASSGALNKATVNQWIKYNENQTVNQLCNMAKRAENKALSGKNSELYVGKNGGISLYDKKSGVSWNSLPDFSNTFAADFFVTVFDGQNLYTLDTSSCRAEKDGFSYTVEGNVLTCLYNLKKDSLSLSLPVEISLDGAYFSVSVDLDNCVLSEGSVIVSISFLPFLGAVRYGANSTDLTMLGDYYLVPDGPGAIIRTALEDERTSYVYSVYGKDYYEDSIPAYLGAYGVRIGENAFSATVTEATENAYIKVIRSNADSFDINRIYPEFLVTEISGNKGDINISANSLSGKCTVVYEALSGSNADYIGMAVSVRQALINCGYLSSEKVKDEYPLFVSVVGSADGKRQGTVTNFQQAENLLSILKAKGINEINMILEGFFKGGITDDADSLKNPSIVGNKNDISELVAYSEKQQLNVFIGVNVFTSSDSSDSVKSIDGNKKTQQIKNYLAPIFGQDSFVRYHRKITELSPQFSELLNYVDNTGVGGIAILDSDISCVSDYSSNNGTVKEYSDEIASNLSSCGVRAQIVLDGANMNIIKYADYIKNITFDTEVAQSILYTAVPFIPAIIHSSYVYTSEAVNNQSVTKLNLLKCVEYGAMPYYLWVFNSESDKYYELTINEAVDFYIKAKTELGDLTSKRITDHFEYESGVYCTVFDSETTVYVNYNNYSVLIDEVAVLPYDYLRIG